MLRPACFVGLLLVVAYLFFGLRAQAAEKITIGEVEEVLLLPWGLRLLARIDTGAATSSLGARELQVRDNIAEFRLRGEYGGSRLRMPIEEWRFIRTPEGKELRPVIKVRLCLGPKEILAEVTLNDRSRMSYPFLIGRNVLRSGSFVVDVSLAKTSRPNCPEVHSP